MIRITGISNEARKPFQFFNYLTEHQDFLPTVKEVWDTTEPLYHSRTALSRFHKKLKLLKQPLRALNKTHYGDLLGRTKQAYEELCVRQNKFLHDPSPDNIAIAAAADEKWNRLDRIKEKFYMQKSCVRWLQVGDKNTRFFILWCKQGQLEIRSGAWLMDRELFSLLTRILKKRQYLIFRPSCRARMLH